MSNTTEYETVASDSYPIDVPPRDASGDPAVRIVDFSLDGRTLTSVEVVGQINSLGNERLLDLAVDIAIPDVGYENRLGDGGEKTTIAPTEASEPAEIGFTDSPEVDLSDQAGNAVEVEADLLVKRYWNGD